MKPIAIAVAIVALVFQGFVVFKYERADGYLHEFYSEIASAHFGAAQESINDAIRLWPTNARYYAWRAYSTSQHLPSQCFRKSHDGLDQEEFDQESVQSAIEDYRHVLALNNRDAVAHHNLAWLEHLLGHDAVAAGEWLQSTEIDPDNAVFHLSYGMFLEESGNETGAMEQYEAAIELTPSIVDSPFFAGYRTRSPEAADLVLAHCIADIESRLQDGADPILEARLGKLYLYSGNLDRSAQLLEDAAVKLPNLPLVWFNLGELSEQRGDSGQAMTCFKKASTLDASLAGPYLEIGEINFQDGQKASAAQQFNFAVQRWQRVNPITSAHNNRLYAGPPQRIDDLLPTTLVWYTTPCEASRAWLGLARLFPEKQEYARRIRTCEQLPSPHRFGNLN